MERNSWNRITIMHQDRKVACIHRNGWCVIYHKSFMPYNLELRMIQKDDIEGRLTNLENFYHWCSLRVFPPERQYSKEILNTLGKKQAFTDRDRAEIAMSYHCLSLLDVYWVKIIEKR